MIMNGYTWLWVVIPCYAWLDGYGGLYLLLYLVMPGYTCLSLVLRGDGWLVTDGYGWL